MSTDPAAAITYAEVESAHVDTKDIRLPRSGTGYGRKLPTQYRVTLKGQKRVYYVWSVCFSNVGSLYIVVKGVRMYLRDSDLDAAMATDPAAALADLAAYRAALDAIGDAAGIPANG